MLWCVAMCLIKWKETKAFATKKKMGGKAGESTKNKEQCERRRGRLGEIRETVKGRRMFLFTWRAWGRQDVGVTWSSLKVSEPPFPRSWKKDIFLGMITTDNYKLYWHNGGIGYFQKINVFNIGPVILSQVFTGLMQTQIWSKGILWNDLSQKVTSDQTVM